MVNHGAAPRPPLRALRPESGAWVSEGAEGPKPKARGTAVGKETTFEEFYGREAEPLRRALCLALGDVDLGTDATDEAMTRAYQRWAEVTNYDNPVGWAYRVGVNWGRSRQRRWRWRDDRPVPDRSVLPVPGDPELARALDRLGTPMRAVVVCRYYLDWSVEQTAAALDIAEGTVKSRLARALERLQADLENLR